MKGGAVTARDVRADSLRPRCPRRLSRFLDPDQWAYSAPIRLCYNLFPIMWALFDKCRNTVLLVLLKSYLGPGYPFLQ